MILETTFVIDFLKGKDDAKSKMKFLIDANANISIAVPTVFELYAGYVQYGKGEKELEKMASFLMSLPLQSLNGESARIAGVIDGTLIKKGLEISTEDSMIAGIAIKNNEIVLTRDDHFKRVEGLKIEGY